MQVKNIVDKYFAIIFMIIPVTWAGSFVAGKYVVLDMDPIFAVFWRFLLSALVMFPFLILFRRNTHPDFRDWAYLRHLLIVVLSGGIIYHVLMFWALKTTSPTNTAIIIALNPFFTAFGEILIFKIKRSPRFYIGFIVAFLGAVWVNIARGDGFALPGMGELLCLCASISWSAYTIFAKKTKKAEWDSLWLGGYNYFFTAVLMLPFILGDILAGHWGHLPQSVWLGLWYMAVFPTAIGYTFYYIGVQKKGPAWAATYIYLVPSFTANLDHVFFGAAFTIPMVVGTTFVVIGLIIGNISTNQVRSLGSWLRRIS